MKDLIVITVDVLIKFFVFGQLYLLWIKNISPAIQEHYSLAKTNAATLEKIPDMWRGLVSDLRTYYCTLKTLIPALIRDINTAIVSSAFLHRNFPAVMEHISRWDRIGLTWENANSMREQGNSTWENDKPTWENHKPTWENHKLTGENDKPTWEKEKSSWENE